MKLSWRKKILLLVLLMVVPLIWSFSAEAAIQGIPGPTFTLTAKTGYIVTDDGNSVFMWGFANGNGLMQYPAPTLIVNEGQMVTVNVSNRLTVPVSIVFPGQVNVSVSGGVPGLFTNEVPPDNGATTVTYSFVAGQPGTYLYYSGTNPDLQVEMGLVGALIVRPNMGANYAYNNADSIFDREHLFLLSEIDPTIHELVNFGRMSEIDNTTAYPVYWFINGRSGLDTAAGNFMPLMPSQPYSALVAMHPNEKVLVRMIGAGRQIHPLHLHGNHHKVIARDGRLLRGPSGEDLSHMAFTTLIAPGQTADAIFTWTGEGNGWDLYGHAPGDPLEPGECPNGLADPNCDHGKPVPVQLPDIKDTTFGPFYSGSPFLGSAGELPPGEGGFNPNSGLFFMWHSHSEKELTSNNIFPGGMLTFVVVEHPDVNIP
jgi:manganese oxidase